MVPELIEARDEKRRLRLQRQLAAYNLLIIDELGYVPLSTTGAELLFEVFSQRYERGSTLVTSNLPLGACEGGRGRVANGMTRAPSTCAAAVEAIRAAWAGRPGGYAEATTP